MPSTKPHKDIQDIPLDIPLGQIKMSQDEKDKFAALDYSPRPRLASTIVLTVGDRKHPKILMGQRSNRHDFMPSVYVFPGGRVDRADSYAKYAGDLSPRSERILETAFAPRKARALVLAAVRETWEETSLLLGRPVPDGERNLNHGSYDAFRQAGIRPDISGIEVFGRAVTPPHRHKRFDAWFFHKHLGDIAPPKIADSAELLNVSWFTFAQIESLEQQRATTMMLHVLKDYLKYDRPPADIFMSKAKKGQMKTGRFP